MTPSERLGAVRSVLARSFRLGLRDGAACLVAWALLHAATLRLRLGRWWPGPRITADPWSPGAAEDPTAVAPEVARLARLLAVAAEHRALGVWCLPRALALRRLLRLHGFRAELALGLRRGPEGLKGHAWVVYHGAVLDGDGALAGAFERCEVA